MSQRNHQPVKFPHGFSLLEVLVALLLLSLSFTTLILVQARATRLAVDARNISIATQLARYQMMECMREAQKKISSVGNLDLEGDFSDLGFEKFTWECHAPKFKMEPLSATDMEKVAKKNAPDAAKGNVGASTSLMSPIMKMISDSLGDSVRELAVIVRWKEDTFDEEVRVVVHVTDPTAMTGLAKMISQGVKNTSKTPDKEEKKSPQEGGK